MILRFFFIISIILFLAACNNTKNNWVNNIILSEKNILAASSINLKSLLEKSDLENSDKLSYEKKIIFDAFKSSFNSQYLGFDINSSQKLFIVSQENNFNSAAFLAGDIIDESSFKETLKNFLAIDSFDLENPSVCFSEKYNLTVGFNSANFLIGFSFNKNFTKEKIISYFQSKSRINQGVVLNNFLKLNNDFGLYISSVNIVNFINDIKTPFLKSQLINNLNLDLLTDEFIFNMNFLEQKIACNTSLFSNIFIQKPVDVKFNNFMIQNDSLMSFGFANIQLNKIGSFFTQLNKYKTGFQDDVLFSNFKEVIPALDGSVAFSINNSLNHSSDQDPSYLLDSFSQNLTNVREKNTKFNSDDSWEDDDFFKDEVITPKFYNSTQFLLSLGVNEKENLVNVFNQNNFKLLDSKVITSKTYSYLLKNKVFHVTNNFEWLEKLNSNIYPADSNLINEKYLQNSLYTFFNIEAISKSYYGENPSTIDYQNDEIVNIFSKILLNSNNKTLNIDFFLKEKNKNALKAFLEAIIENKIVEDYL